MIQQERLRLAGIACGIGGALWVSVLMADVVAHATIYDTSMTYRVWETLLILVQALLLAGVVGLAISGATGGSRLGWLGLVLVLLGRTSFLAGELHSFVQGSDDELLVPLGAMLTAIGMTVAGVTIVRAGRWDGWRRVVPLATGLYPFVTMFPILTITGDPPTPMIALWGILWLLLGIALHAKAQAPAALRQTQPATASA